MIINRDCSVEGAFAGISLDSVSHRVTPHSDAGSSGGYYLCQYSWIPHQVRNDETAGSRKVPLVGIAFAGISGYRVVARYDV